MTEFLAMGGYGVYVWSAYALTAFVLVANVVMARARERSSERDLKGRMRRDERRSRS